MRSLQMNRKIGSLLKRPVTTREGALVRVPIRVGIHVLCQVLFLRKFTLANSTLKKLFLKMDLANVASQTKERRQYLSTVIA